MVKALPELTEADKRNGWTREAKAEYQAERETASAERIWISMKAKKLPDHHNRMHWRINR